MLKNIQRQGWTLLGLKNNETVAEHSLRAAQIGYFLAKLEHFESPEKIVTMLIFHDIGECRIGDIHKVAKNYINSNEKKAVCDQLKPLGSIGNILYRLWEEMYEQTSTAAIIAKDADLLEMAVTAFEMRQRPIHGVQNWIENIRNNLQTDSAKYLLQQLENTDRDYWWGHLKKI